MTLPYAVGSYIGAALGITFYPWPGIQAYESAAIEQSATLLFVAGLGALSGISQFFQHALSRAAASFHGPTGMQAQSRVGVRIALLIAWIVGLHDFAFVAVNFTTIVNSSRHTFRSDFWAGNGPFGIVLSLTVSAILALAVVQSTRKRYKYLVPLVLFWFPTLIAGGRNYLSVTVIAAAALLFVVWRSLRSRTLLLLGLVFGVWGFAIVPTLWSENPLIWLNEWIMPNTLYLSVLFGYIDTQMIGVSGFWQQMALLLPSQLRPYEVATYGEVFQGLELTNVGVGGNPWADFYSPDQWSRIFGFTIGTLSLFLIGGVGAKWSPVVPAMTVGLMAFWGRSSYWNVMFIMVYLIVISAIFVSNRSRKNAP